MNATTVELDGPAASVVVVSAVVGLALVTAEVGDVVASAEARMLLNELRIYRLER